MSNPGRYLLKRLEEWPEDGSGGWWLLGDEVMFRCPLCHQNGGVPLHSIDGAGVINASLLCDCGWHEFAVLDAWPAGWSKAAGVAKVSKGGAA
jgi:hypothetical protein